MQYDCWITWVMSWGFGGEMVWWWWRCDVWWWCGVGKYVHVSKLCAQPNMLYINIKVCVNSSVVMTTKHDRRGTFLKDKDSRVSIGHPHLITLRILWPASCMCKIFILNNHIPVCIMCLPLAMMEHLDTRESIEIKQTTTQKAIRH